LTYSTDMGWNVALTALQVAIVIWDATALAAMVLVFRAAYLPWRIARGGWGLRLLDLLSDRWGMAESSTRVWFELPVM